METKHTLTLFSLPKMDCASEERLVRMALENIAGIKKLTFNLESRQLRAIHTGELKPLLTALVSLKLGARIEESRPFTESDEARETAETSASESRVLWLLVAINAAMFGVELVAGVLAQSTALIADSIDMFADAAVYGLSLYAVGKTLVHKQRAARFSGYFQILLAAGTYTEVIRRFIYGSEPEGILMIVFAAVALAANIVCMILLAKHRTGEVHMRASWIFSTNDAIANIGVIVAGVLVTLFRSAIPDLVIGTVIATVVLSGAKRILKMSRVAAS